MVDRSKGKLQERRGKKERTRHQSKRRRHSINVQLFSLFSLPALSPTSRAHLEQPRHGREEEACSLTRALARRTSESLCFFERENKVKKTKERPDLSQRKVIFFLDLDLPFLLSSLSHSILPRRRHKRERERERFKNQLRILSHTSKTKERTKKVKSREKRKNLLFSFHQKNHRKNRKKLTRFFPSPLLLLPLQPVPLIPSVAEITSSRVISASSPLKSLSSVRKSMQWHSFLSLIGTHGQFQKPCAASASLSS